MRTKLTLTVVFVAILGNCLLADAVEPAVPIKAQPFSLNRVRLRPARDDKASVVVMYGPLVLAGELGREGMPDSDCNGNNVAHADNKAPLVPVLVGASQDPSAWLKRDPGEPLRFRTVGVVKPKDVSLIPLANLHHQRYTV